VRDLPHYADLSAIRAEAERRQTTRIARRRAEDE
jgi:hypothetical protein